MLRAKIRSLLAGVWRRSEVEKGMAQELQFHIEARARDLSTHGVRPEEASRQACREFGSLEKYKEEIRHARGLRLLDELRGDLKYAFRMLAKSRGFALTAILTLALGLGLNTAIFSIVNAVFFKPLPVPEPDELMYLYSVARQNSRPFVVAYPDYLFFREHNEAFTDLTFHWSVPSGLSADGETETVRGEMVAANYFDVLRIKPAIGRTFLPEEDDPSNNQLALVISHSLWQRRFDSNPAVIGKQVRLDDAMFTIVGVSERGFDGVSDPWTRTQFWVTSAQRAPEMYRNFGIIPIGRLKPGVTIERAKAIIATQGEQLKQSRSWVSDERFIALAAKHVTLPFDPNGTFGPARLAAALMIVVGTVLLIAVVNIAGILMARMIARRGEAAIRQALGGGTFRIVRQWLAESMMLSLIAGVLGLWLARILLTLFNAYSPARFSMDVPLDIRVVVFAAGLCISAGLAAGLGPALRATKVNVAAALAGSGVAGNLRSRLRLRHSIVIPQVSLSLVLLLVAGLYGRVLINLEVSNPGYNTDDTVVVGVRLSDEPSPMRARNFTPQEAEKDAERTRMLYRRLYDGIRNVPNASRAAITSRLPLRADPGFDRFYRVISEDDYLSGGREGFGGLQAAVTPGYFETMGMSLLRGRDFDDRDVMPNRRVAIISERIAERLWPGRDPLDRTVAFFANRQTDKLEWMQVVGVVNDVHPVLHDIDETPFIYVPVAQQWRPFGIVVAKGAADLTALIEDLKKAVTGSDVYAEVASVRTMNQTVAEILYPRRMAAAMLTVSGLIGLLLACVGTYGVISYSVAQRIREIGIRAALGARRSDIIKLVLKEGMNVAFFGLLSGMILAHIALRIASRAFAAVPGFDWMTSLIVPLFLAAVILLACWIPARRGSRVDPMQILRGL
jgi:putative ABC transport system permease protein